MRKSDRESPEFGIRIHTGQEASGLFNNLTTSPRCMDFRRDLENWAGQVEGNWMGLKVEVNRECQMLDREPCTIFTQGWQKARLDLPLS